MISDILKTRVSDYSPTNELEQENVLQEIVQHYVLASLARSGLFPEAIFHGGTCLRIFYGMSRFSEDLDFMLKEPDRDFRWAKHVGKVQEDGALEGLALFRQPRLSVMPVTAAQFEFIRSLRREPVDVDPGASAPASSKKPRKSQMSAGLRSFLERE